MSNKKALSRKEQFKALINHKDVKGRLLGLVGGDDKKFEKLVATLENIAFDGSLSKCDIRSVVKAGVMLAETGLPLSKQLGAVWIVPFKNSAEAIVGYKGWKLLLRDEGVLVKTRVIFDCDEFNYDIDGFDEVVKLKPCDDRLEGNDKWVKEHYKGVLVSVKFVELGEVEHYYISRSILEKLINLSKSKNSKYSPYNSGFFYEMLMARATSYVARKIGVRGEKIAKAFEVENNESTLKVENNESDVIDEVNEVEDILDIEVEEIKEEELEDAK